MWSALLQRSRSHYPLVAVLLTRMVGTLGGLLTIAYVYLTGAVPVSIRTDFYVMAACCIMIAVVVTATHALQKTRKLRSALKLLFRGDAPSMEEGQAAVMETVQFNLVHHRVASWLVPLVTTFPVSVLLRLRYGLDWFSLFNVIAATLLGLSLSLLLMYFLTMAALLPVIRLLGARGYRPPMKAPIERLQYRVVLCFSVILVCAVTMVGAVAIHRLHDVRGMTGIVQRSGRDLEWQLFGISGVSMLIGFFYSRLLAASVTSRVGELVFAMNAIQGGELGTRVHPHGSDEIEILGHRFNEMVQDLQTLHNQLEQKVEFRTRQLQDSLSKLQELDHLKTEFFSNVSHELRTPLMMILSPIRQLKTELEESLDSRSQSLLEVAHNNGHRLLKQINQLLEFSKIEAGRATVAEGAVDLNEIARRLAFAANPLAEQRGIRMEIDLDPQLPVTSSDEDKLDMVLTNLVSNAIKFTPSGGCVRIVTRVVESPRPGGQWLRVVVEDTGRGIAPEDFSRLFQRFVQLDGSTSREYAGTGLGLALARELIELLGGRIWVESEVGVGSQFQFELPWKSLSEEEYVLDSPSGLIRQESFAELKRCRIEADSSRRQELPRFAQTVMVVEDNAQIRDLLVDLLDREYHVLIAEDGLQAIAELGKQTPDLIISDIMMPFIDGQELCRRVKERRDTANVPFLLLTARSKTTMKIEGLDCGAEDYVCKPFEEAELLARVRALLRVRRATVQLDQRNSELEKTNRELKQTQQQLVHAEKLSSLGQLVAGLAHEINNSINAVYNGIPAMKLRLQKLRRGLSNGVDTTGKLTLRPELEVSFDKLDILANVISDGAERTARIVSDMKTFAHPGRDRDEEFDVHRALDLCLNLSVKQSVLTVHIDRRYAEIPSIYGPYGQLHQVFLNLMSNAVQAMGTGGQLTVKTEMSAGFITVRIHDTGAGIPEKIRNRIFEPFFTTKAPGVGTGLGLSISYSIVTKLGGSIDCESEPGEGTEFTLRIPLPDSMLGEETLTAYSKSS